MMGGQLAEARIDVPGGWYAERRTGTSAVFVGPDNFSRISFTAAPTLASPEACGGIFDREIQESVDALGKSSPTKARLISREAEQPSGVRVKAVLSPENLPERVQLGRVVCRSGAVAVVNCSYGSAREATHGRACQRVIESLSVAEPAERQLPPVLQPTVVPASSAGDAGPKSL